jgi:glutathione S-transferase
VRVKLIGMLDSPYVRRVAISLQLLGLEFDHWPLSVFRDFEQFQGINPVVKVPTLICDDGEVLMDSTLILQYAETIAASGRGLMPTDIAGLKAALHTLGLALAACEKSVQIYYEGALRPPEKMHQPWVDRITGQVRAAYGGIEAELKRRPLAVTTGAINQAGITVAVAWQFTQQTIPGVVAVADHPLLRAFSERAEQLPVFAAAPHGPGRIERPSDRGA